MRTTENSAPGANEPLTAEQIINDFIGASDMATFSECLHEMFLAFVSDPDCPAGEFKNNVVFTYTSLRDLIQRVGNLQRHR